MAYISKLTNLDGSTYDIKSKKTAAIPFGQVDSTSTETEFTATVDGITELYDGVCCYLRNGVVTSAANCTLNINGLGAKPLYSSLAAASRSTTIFNVNYTMLFIYNSTRVTGGCWDVFYGYDSNTNTIGYQLRTNSSTLPVSDITARYRLLFTSADNKKWVPANTSTSTNATSARAVNQRPIDPFGPIVYYSYTTQYAANANVGAGYQWTRYAITLGYSFNRTGAALALTYPAPVYVKCAPQSDGSAIIDADTPYVQSLPSTEDGKIYIYLGRAYSATAMELTEHHPVYEYKDGQIRLYTNANSEVDIISYLSSGVEIAKINGNKIYSPGVTNVRQDGNVIVNLGGYDIYAYDSLVVDIGTINDVAYGTPQLITLDSSDYYLNIAQGVGSKKLDVSLKTTLVASANNESILCNLSYIDRILDEASVPIYVFCGVTASLSSYSPVLVLIGIIDTQAIILPYKLASAFDLDDMQSINNLVTSISASSTNDQYPSAKLFYDTVGNLETLLAAI